MARITNIENFRGGLSLVDPTNLEDNQFEVLKNMQYNKDKRVQTRRGYQQFGNAIGSNPITSVFFFQNDTDGTRTLLCTAGTQMYKYNEGTSDWDSIRTGLQEFEADGTTRTRWSFAAYLNIIYMSNGRDCYASYDPATSTYTELGTSAVGTCTFDSSTDKITLATHGLSNGASVKFTTTGTLPAELTAGQWYYVVNKDTNDFEISNTPGGTAIDFTDNGSGTHTCTKTTQPRVRYLRYMADSIYGAGEDLNPSTVWATTAGAGSAADISANDIKVGGDELGRINGLLDLGAQLLIFKNKKIYSVAGDLASSEAIDAQNGGYCHRSLRNVENAIMYYSDAGVDRVKPRSGLAGASSIVSEPLSDDLRSLLDDIHPQNRNDSAGFYSDYLNNYYFSFDTGNDSVPDTTLVYSSLVGAWSQYVTVPFYDYTLYIDANGNEKLLAASATGGQMYEIEVGFQDNNLPIETELKTKKWDFNDSGTWKTFDAVDLIGLKNEGSNITVEILVDDEVVGGSTITDDFIDFDSSTRTIGEYPIGDYVVGGGQGGDIGSLELYPYLIRIPMFDSGPDIQVRMYSESNPNFWTLDQMKISREDEAFDFFPINNIG